MKPINSLTSFFCVVTFFTFGGLIKAADVVASEVSQAIVEQPANVSSPLIEIPLVPIYEESSWLTKNQLVSYWIGKNDVTVEQYTAFLNAVAATDTYHLYDERMECVSAWDPYYSYMITRSGSPGHYTYRSTSNNGLTPISFVDLYCALRFCNWLHNGQSVGNQDKTTTERGAYTLDGATATQNSSFTLNTKEAKWFIPTYDQWNKISGDIMSDNGIIFTMLRWSATIDILLHSNTLSAFIVQSGMFYGVSSYPASVDVKSSAITFRVAAPVSNLNRDERRRN
ncbi:MAG: hypothetical protein A3F67_00995 [Verrucomicrobia bacterium RIFCSPHIGHO2_12_FULL_41_10]|nr:MAG: hypothetical protein A3F67_00995 [Verrucomicrobia bacterium RIFCSPHIGHO2_12_FULL_41_10]HLB33110.1 hypothetical protein [Chthoniobacterales bacterium]